MTIYITMTEFVRSISKFWALFSPSGVSAPERTGAPAVEFGEELTGGDRIEGVDEPPGEGGDDDKNDDDDEDEEEDDLVEEPGVVEPEVEEAEPV